MPFPCDRVIVDLYTDASRNGSDLDQGTRPYGGFARRLLIDVKEGGADPAQSDYEVKRL
jgi:hypothetical protein